MNLVFFDRGVRVGERPENYYKIFSEYVCIIIFTFFAPKHSDVPILVTTDFIKGV